MKKGFTLIELLLVVTIIAILVTIAVPTYYAVDLRAKVSRVSVDQRSLATGIASYYVDNKQYPVSARNGRHPAGMANINSFIPHSPTSLEAISSFSARQGSLQFGGNRVFPIATLTTPIAYINDYIPDPFMDTKGATYAYYNDTTGWIIWSPGPNRDQATATDLGNALAVETVYFSQWPQPSSWLIAGTGANHSDSYTYDPSNGTESPGDIWRIKQ